MSRETHLLGITELGIAIETSEPRGVADQEKVIIPDNGMGSREPFKGLQLRWR